VTKSIGVGAMKTPRALSCDLTDAPSFPEFLTLPAYDMIIAEGA
jgi:hypothetical protein